MQPWQNAIMADPGFAQQRAWWAAKRAARAARKVISDRRGRGIVPPKMMFFPRDNTFGYVPGKRPYRGGYKRRYGGGFKRRFKRFGRRRFGSRWGRRRSSRRYGRGGYWGDWVGRKLGGYFGLGDLGGRIGSWGGDRLQSWLGLGSYAKRASGYGGYYDSQIGATYEHDQDIPIMSNPGGTDGPVVIRHREYIGDVNSTGSGFNIAYKLGINPGLIGSFPWLAAVANSFTQWRCQGMIFHFKSTSGALSTTQALGEIVMACNYDVGNPDFSSKQQMLNEVFSISKVPSLDAECPVECDPAQTSNVGMFYVRPGEVPGKDLRFYDVGTFYVATQGQASACILGELWVTYQIALYKPQLIAGPGIGTFTHMVLHTVNAASPLGTTQTIYDNWLNLSVTVGYNTLEFPAGSPLGCYYLSFSRCSSAVGRTLGDRDFTCSAGIAKDPKLFSNSPLLNSVLQSPNSSAPSYSDSFTAIVQLTNNSVAQQLLFTLATSTGVMVNDLYVFYMPSLQIFT